ncbi:hypothetical protein FOLKNPGA_01249 [Legionella sp. PC1000]|uniref:hypothetical protein n=1 Tax=Legionella sp. PC1000 TaxID=2746060 RepID=UPI0015FCD447|nr:hypothetical protein [Legionella sp. PC1000]QLZ68470.1 hypothetical protein FOLKNPGA_01249 [Legionella sp. PC1000]
MSDDKPWTWEQFVNKLKIMFSFNPNFDLVKHFRELHSCIQYRERIREEFKLKSKEHDKKLIRKTVRDLEKSLIPLEKNSLRNQETINSTKNTINKHTDALHWNIIIPQRYSKTQIYISKLCGIFYEGTGQMPAVKSNRKSFYGSGEYERYSGNFYEFLLEAKPLLAEIGIELGDNYETIGKYAYQIVNGDKTKGSISFAKLLEEMETNPDTI